MEGSARFAFTEGGGYLISVSGPMGYLIYIAVVYLLFGLPMSLIFRRMGYTRWWGVAMSLPIINLFLAWIFVFRQWPLEQRAQTVPMEVFE